MAKKGFKFGEWNIDPEANALACGSMARPLEPRAMDVLVYLCAHPNEVISAEQLLEACWGTTVFGDNPVHKVITQLRKALGDSAAGSRYIETIRKRGYRTIAAVLYEDDLLAGSWLHDSPFRGLQAFEEAHAGIFFGRKLASRLCLQVMRSQAQAGCALTLVLGPSGSGKTSLVRAGVLPQLDLACHLHLDLADVADGGLLQALGSVLLDCDTGPAAPFEGDSAATLGQRLRQDPAAVGAQLQQVLASHVAALFVDRFEALFRMAHTDEAERVAFIDALEQLACAECLHVILACRNDFYPHLANYAPLMRLKQRGAHVDLNPLGQAEIAQIVRQPAQAAQLRFDTDPDSGVRLDEALCAEAQARPDVLPLLQYCLHELYRQRSPDGVLSFAVFRALGGIEGAIGVRAEEVAAGMDAAEIAALPRVLAQLVSIADGEPAITSRCLPWSALNGAAELELVKHLVEARLFVSDLNAGVPTFGVAHDALLRRWPRVVAWIDNHRHALQLRTRLSAQAQRWQASGRRRDFLLPRGTQANQARELLQLPGFQLGPVDRDFITTSLQLVKRGERWRAAVLGIVASLAMLASALGLFARAAQREAEQHRVEAEGLMGYMLGEFTDKLRPLGRLDLLDSVSARALAYLSGARHDEHDDVAVRQRAKALQVIAEVRIARGDPAGATQALVAAQHLLRMSAERQAPDKVLLKALGTNAYWLGQIRFDQRDWEGAQSHFGEYLGFSNALVRLDPLDPDGWAEQAYAHSNLGTVALKRGAAARAAEEFRTSLALKARVQARNPARQDLVVDLANSLSWLASAEEKLGHEEAAMQLYQREADLMRGLHAAVPGNAYWTQHYAFALWHQAEMQVELDKLAAARADFAEAEDLLQSLVKHDPSNRSWQSALYTVQFKSSEIRPGPTAERIASLGALQARLAVLIGLEPKKFNLQRLHALMDARRAQLLWDAGRHADARRELAAALATLERVRAAAPSDQPIRDSLADTLLLQAAFDSAEHDDAQVRLACRTLDTLLHPDAAAGPAVNRRTARAYAGRCT